MNSRSLTLTLLAALSLSVPSPVDAATRAVAPPKKAATSPPNPGRTSAPKAALSPAKNTLQWEAWYTIEANGGVPYGYYSDRVEKTPDGRLHYENKTWKLEEGWINEESLGAFALNDANLTPLFFNFWSNYRSSETQVDGTITDGKQLSVRVKTANKELPIIKRSIPEKTSLSVLFPLWLGKAVEAGIQAGQKTGTVKTFRTIFEDDFKDRFAPRSGSFRIEAADDFAAKTGPRKVRVESRDMPSIWYITEAGLPIRIVMPASKILVEKVDSREKAEAYIRSAPATHETENDDATDLEQ